LRAGVTTADYGVSHTTFLRYFERPEVSKQLLRTQRRRDLPWGRRNARVTSQAASGSVGYGMGVLTAE